MRARCAIGLDLHAVRGDFARERLGIRHGPGPAPGKPIFTHQRPSASIRCRISIFSSMLDRKPTDFASHRERFVIQKNAQCGRDRRRRGEVPIVNPFILRQEAPCIAATIG